MAESVSRDKIGERDLDKHLGSLMHAAQAGDKDSYRELLSECEPLILQAANELGLCNNQIERVVRDTLMTVHRARHTYDRSRSFMMWLNVIAQRRITDAS